MREPTATNSPRVLIVSASVGAGHDGAARELGRRLATQGVAVETRDFLDALPSWVAYTVREGYTRTVTHTPWFYDWLYDAMERRGPARCIGLLVCRLAARRVLRWCRDTGAEAVVSTYPLASQTLGQMVARGRLAVPTATFLTDPSVHALWVHRHVHRHLTTMPATAEVGESGYGIAMTVVGPLVPSHFADPVTAHRRAALLGELGIPADRRIALVVTGSLGLGHVADTVDAIVATGVATPLVLCGRNDRLLRELSDRVGVYAVGWRNDIHELMQVCDVLVHNAGGLSFSESLVAGLPAVTYACIPGHGKANGQVLARSGVAPLANTVPELRAALEHQLRPQARAVVRTTVGAAEHDASQVVVNELRTAGTSARLSAQRARLRHRTTLRRRISGVAVAALVTITSLGATEGVSAATSRGYGVASMPVASVALVIRPRTLAGVARDAPLLARMSAAVLVPDNPDSTDLAAAKTLGADGVILLSSGCPGGNLLRHTQAQRCGARDALKHAGTPAASIVVSEGELEALDLVVARRDRTRLVLAGRTIAGTPPAAGADARTSRGGVWVIAPAAYDGSAGNLARTLNAVDRTITDLGLSLRPVTDARARS